MKQTELAELAGCSIPTINRHLVHGRVLKQELVVRIYYITFGAVRPDDYYDLENVPADIKALMNPNHPLRKRLSGHSSEGEQEATDVA